MHNIKHNRSYKGCAVTVETEDRPHLEKKSGTSGRSSDWRVPAHDHFGFMEDPDIPYALDHVGPVSPSA
jgi:K+ transporter